ncbi:MAG: glycogen debranching enzyme family protein [Planctomycetes bacterium]|nr:glycogen debranching enzyme family protein [Planctomycetota bacterium]
MSSVLDKKAEWLEADGLGGFASGTAALVRTRRYHALLLAATKPPTGRFVLVNGLEAWVETPQGTYPLSAQAYPNGVEFPQGAQWVEDFHYTPWPKWRYQFENGLRLTFELFSAHGQAATVLIWRVAGACDGAVLAVRPLISGRDPHALHHENGSFRFEAEVRGEKVLWRPYQGVPDIAAWSNGAYEQKPDWYRNFFYAEEQARGLDCTEDLAAPGVFRWKLGPEAPAVLILAAETAGSREIEAYGTALNAALELEKRAWVRREAFATPLERAADAYLVRRGEGHTIVAGYPWFTDWGRDTFIALRGLCLATGRLEIARSILLEWSGVVDQGMLPNLFPDRGAAPEYNSVDASLWYVVAVHDYLEARAARGESVPAADLERLRKAVSAILCGYAGGTRYGIRADADGLLAAGQPGMQLTWMDAKIGDWVVTPRSGKPVEVQALWMNALRIGARFQDQWTVLYERAYAAFEQRFWNPATGGLYDVVDADHVPGRNGGSFRPNQLFAVGGLPFPILVGERARRVVDAVEAKLWTPAGLRSLAPGEPGYAPHYAGGVRERDGAYHQGTVWPWLLGPFVEAWVRVRGGSARVKREARARFLQPVLERMGAAGLGHIAEIADAEPPHAPNGCPFQAWSVGEALRLDLDVLREAEDGVGIKLKNAGQGMACRT